MKKGFTLVELLVVIGIIAVLISILLPSLAKARQAATTLQCAANLRTIGQALSMYTAENKGCFPYGWANDPSGTIGHDLYWYTTLANTLGAPSNNPWDSGANQSMKYFICPDVTIRGDYSWIPVSSYGAHPVAFGTWFWGYGPLGGKWPGQNGLYKQVWLQKNSTEKCIMWDCTINTTDNPGWGFPSSGNCNGDQYWWGTYLIDEPGIWNSWTGRPGTFGQNQASLNGAFAEKPDNRAGGGGGMDTYRFRHMGNSACNFLFGDGHVETRKAQRKGESLDQGTTDLTNLNFAVPYPVAGLIPQ